MRLKGLRKLFEKGLRLWEGFWFAPQSLEGISLFRLVFCSLLFFQYSIRAIDTKILFFDKGLMPASQVINFMPEFYRPLFYWFPREDWAVVLITICFLVLLLGLALGLFSRCVMWLVWILHWSLLQRNYSIIYGADLISGFWLLYLSLIDSHRHFSLWSWWKKRIKGVREKEKECLSSSSDLLSSVGIRLIQVQLCITYAYTGWEKLKGSDWWEGTAVWQILGNPFLAPVDFSFFSHIPLAIVVATWGTLIFEVYFCVLVWIKKIRPYWLLLGTIMHLSIALTTGLYFFSGIMIAAYLAFLNKVSLRATQG